MSPLPIIGYTLGDQAGIGPEIISSALHNWAHPDIKLQLIGHQLPSITPGLPTQESAQAAWDHLELGAQALKEGRIAALVTGPVSKEGLHACGFPFPGQTEFFASRLGVEHDHAMCLSGQRLTVALATTHIALRDVPDALSTDQLVRVALLLTDFIIETKKSLHPRPRIALAGLNPHNGENGAFGDEESRLIAPAVTQLQALRPDVDYIGPCVPDVVYRDAADGAYDGIVAPYHDQALIPLKLLDFDNAVNVTLGLPRLRISPDHGTAFSLAGKGLANASSMRAAFELALQYTRYKAQLAARPSDFTI